ncbi:MAG: Dabb family protein [Bacteroidales bacterium]
MIKHVLLFKLREMETPELKMEIMLEIKTRLEGLKAVIPAIHSIEVGINANPKESYDIALISEHQDWDALATYRDDPHHVAVAQFIAQYREERACADFVF